MLSRGRIGAMFSQETHNLSYFEEFKQSRENLPIFEVRMAETDYFYLELRAKLPDATWYQEKEMLSKNALFLEWRFNRIKTKMFRRYRAAYALLEETRK